MALPAVAPPVAGAAGGSCAKAVVIPAIAVAKAAVAARMRERVATAVRQRGACAVRDGEGMRIAS
jgi:hypothetical protein